MTRHTNSPQAGQSSSPLPQSDSTVSRITSPSPWPARAIVREVGLRDGLQSISLVLPTLQKQKWIRAAYEAGQREIEVGSFVPARLLPQLADTAELVQFAKTLPGLFVSVLVPNLIGAQRAMDEQADMMLVPLSASHAHSVANLRKTPKEAIAEVARMRAERDARGSRTRLEVGIGTAFGCTLQGRVEPEDVLALLQDALDAGADQVSLADTVGHADPASVLALFSAARNVAGDRLCCGHFHDTRGLALANVMAALQTGIERYDSSLAGIGGCPHAPGASGNAATEDLVYMLQAMHIQTGIDLPRLLELREQVADWLAGESLHGTLWRAGIPAHQAPAFPSSIQAGASSALI